jgi:hypothetical protein
MKQCTKCGQLKPYDDYHKDRCAPGGRRSWCKACLRVQREQQKTGIPAAKRGPGPGRQNRHDTWECLSDPTQMYRGRFQRIDFVGTLADGYWPEGSLWEGAVTKHEPPSRWRIRNGAAHEENGRRVLLAQGEDRPTLKVVTL